MNIKNTLFAFSSLFLLANTNLSAQHNHTNHRCAMSADDAALVKNRMLENRRLHGEHARNAVTTYIPLAITIVRNSSGQGGVDPQQLYDMVCDLNRDYLDQNIQFYVLDSFRLRNNDATYNDGFSFQASTYMTINKIPGNVINIYVSATVNNQAASYYSPGGDYVFMMNSMADGNSNTATHELGHFFSLPHTFDGWEGVDYHPTYNTATTPTNMGGRGVERFARTGAQANCSTAGDGFCDTPADYLSNREACPYVGENGVVAKDPLGTLINPDETLYMSYFLDACVNRFSTQQKAAIAADISQRGWSALPAPNPATTISNSAVVVTAPTNNQSINIGGSGTNITLDWEPVTGANFYLVKLERTLQGVPISTIFTTTVRNATAYTFNSSQLPTPSAAGHTYTWSVQPMSNFYTCLSFTPAANFIARNTAVSVEETVEKGGLSFRVSPNPVNSDAINLLVRSNQTMETSLRLYSLEGKLLTQSENLPLNEGENALHLDVSSLANGLYIAVLTNKEGVLSQKFQIAR
jgi:hypothetical protein